MATPALPSAVGPVAASAALLPIGGAGDQSAAGRASLDMTTGSGTDDSFRSPTFADALKFHMSDTRSGVGSATTEDKKPGTETSGEQPPTPDAAAIAFLPSNLNVALALLQSTASTAPSSAAGTGVAAAAARSTDLPQALAPASQGLPPETQAATAEILAAPGKTPRYQDVANAVQTQASSGNSAATKADRLPAPLAANTPARATTSATPPATQPRSDISAAPTAMPTLRTDASAKLETAAETAAAAAAAAAAPAPRTDPSAPSAATPAPRADPSATLTATPVPPVDNRATRSAASAGADSSATQVKPATPRNDTPPLSRETTTESARNFPPSSQAAVAAPAPKAGTLVAEQGHLTRPASPAGVLPPLVPPAAPAAIAPAPPPASAMAVSEAAQSVNMATTLPAAPVGVGDKASSVRRPTAHAGDLAPATMASPLPEPPMTTLAPPVANRPPVDQVQANSHFFPPLDTAAPSVDTGRAEFAGLLATQTPAMTPRQDAPTPSSTVHTPFGAPGWSEEVGKNVVWLAGQDQQKAELVLTPPNLGRIEISVTISNDQASASFVSANPAVREALEQALPRLREMFANAGISLGQTSIGAESSASGDNERGSSRHAGRRGRSLDANSILGPSTPSTGRQGIGMVDTFA